MEISTEETSEVAPECFTRSLGQTSDFQVQYDDDLKQKLKLAAIFGTNTFNLIFEANDESHIPKDPYKLKNQLSNRVLHHNQITKILHTRQGKLLIQTSGIEAALELSEIKEVLGSKVTVKTPLENITSKFLLRDIGTDLDLKILVEEIEGTGIAVNNAQRFTKKGTKEPSELVLITTYGNQIPKEIRLFWSINKIEKFVDSPRQCLKCFKFNHSTKKCKVTEALCPRCGSTHLETCPAESPSCVNCKAPHQATDKTCPSRKNELKILKFKSDHCLTFTEARRSFYIKEKNSYAEVTAQTIPQRLNEKSLQNILTNTIKELGQALTSSFNANLEALSRSFDSKLEALNKAFDNKIEALINTFDNRLAQVIQTTTQLAESAKPNIPNTSPKRKAGKQNRTPDPTPFCLHPPSSEAVTQTEENVDPRRTGGAGRGRASGKVG